MIFYFSLIVRVLVFFNFMFVLEILYQNFVLFLFLFFLDFYTLVHNEETLSESLLVELESDETRMVAKYIQSSFVSPLHYSSFIFL